MGSSDGWLGIAAMFIAGLFAWLNKRDSLRHDAELIAVKNQATLDATKNEAKTKALETQNTQQAIQIAGNTAALAKCDDEHQDTREKLAVCEAKHETNDERLSKVEAAVAKIPVPANGGFIPIATIPKA